MKLLYNQNVPRSLWREFIKVSPYASPFQTPDFFELFNSVPGYSANVLALEESGSLIALSVITAQKESGLKAFFSRRGIIYGGPLIDPDHPDALSELIKHIQEFFKNKVIYLEVRNYFDYSQFKSRYVSKGWRYEPWLNFHLLTTDKLTIEASMSRSRLRQIHKAIKSGASWKEADKIEDIQSFYKILADLYKEKVGKPLMKWEFFKEFFVQKAGKYLLVYFNEKVIGGIMCPILPEKSIYEFYVCGLDQGYKEQHPSVMATWAAIEYANRNGIPLFDFMGAGSQDDQYGVRDFKERFGGELVEYGRFLKVLNPFLYENGKAALKLMAKIKK
jgi:serine/alanine adding enzyme